MSNQTKTSQATTLEYCLGQAVGAGVNNLYPTEETQRGIFKGVDCLRHYIRSQAEVNETF